ncbi:Glucosamine-6-phosphate isomerase (Glucosamine-6-phosphate deaminase) (GNPDA) (GlcN6P deaminase) [Ceratobasidium sp. 370]|nr:Glucosamine-6-phosphate isomerase (Glucosamine-6-phosphate deaminase) (GNPDA) (GlcN6P deaminase) [Ceratobasidium sp. 370]
MDEYVGLPEDHPESYHTFMFREFFSHIDINPKNVHILDGNAPDLIQECKSYEEKIKQAGGIDLFLGGIGEDGHIAFNEPGSSLASRTRIKTLAYDTILANSRFFGNDLSKVPRMALTVGVATWTLSALQMHPWSLIVCDEDATAELHVKTVKYFKSIEMVQREVERAHQKDEAQGVGGMELPLFDADMVHINHLPSEVLAHIFELGTASPENETGQDDLPALVSLVCRTWHTLALATPTLWNTLVIADNDPPPLSKLRTHLVRSKHAPLNLYLDFSTRAEPERAQAVMRVLLPELARWRHLVIVVPAFDVMYAAVGMIATAFDACGGAAALEVLRLYGPPEFDPTEPEPHDLPTPVSLFGAGDHAKATPRLRDVVLCGIPVDWSTFLPNTLERLQLSLHSGSRRPTFAQFARLTTGSPNLHTLILNASGPALPPTTHDVPRVQLDGLRSLTLDCFDPEYVEGLLKRFYTPALETLALADAVGDSSRVFEVLAASRTGTLGPSARTDGIGRSVVQASTSSLSGSGSSASVDSLASPSVFPRLTTLKISSVECTPASFRQLVRGLPNLTSVKLDARDADPAVLGMMAEPEHPEHEVPDDEVSPQAEDDSARMERICPQLRTVTCTGVPGSAIREFVERRLKARVPVRTVRVCVAPEGDEEREDGRNWLSTGDRAWLEKHVELEFFDEDEDEEIDGGAWWSTWDA